MPHSSLKLGDEAKVLFIIHKKLAVLKRESVSKISRKALRERCAFPVRKEAGGDITKGASRGNS